MVTAATIRLCERRPGSRQLSCRNVKLPFCRSTDDAKRSSSSFATVDNACF
jgi:hypothetical protein